MFGLVSKKKYNDAVEQIKCLSRGIDIHAATIVAKNIEIRRLKVELDELTRERDASGRFVKKNRRVHR